MVWSADLELMRILSCLNCISQVLFRFSFTSCIMDGDELLFLLVTVTYTMYCNCLLPLLDIVIITLPSLDFHSLKFA